MFQLPDNIDDVKVLLLSRLELDVLKMGFKGKGKGGGKGMKKAMAAGTSKEFSDISDSNIEIIDTTKVVEHGHSKKSQVRSPEPQIQAGQKCSATSQSISSPTL